MNERVNVIVGQVRTYLGEAKAPLHQTIYNKSTRIQNLILRDLKPEKVISLFGEYYLDGFDFTDEKSFLIKKILTSWGDKLTYVNPQLWDDYSDATSSYPYYYTIFANKIYLAPKPVLGNNLTLWGHQLGVFNEMADDIPPEVPEYADEALIHGIVSCFNVEWEPKFLAELERITSIPHIKDTGLREMESNW